MWEINKFMTAEYTFVHPTIPNNNTKHTESGTCECMHASAPKKSARIVGKLLDMTLLYACASSYFCFSL
jgi:hypothetical protein